LGSEAQFNLGAMFLAGRGVLQDHAQAYIWFNLAASGAKTAKA
jgi:TPR repeat protein